jgi:hypothetical protein
MQISVLINAHENSPILSDTIDSIKLNLTKNILLNIDGYSKDTFDYKDIYKMKGFIHNCYKSPYKNMALGLWKTWQTWKDSDWYAYIEPDCLICSNKIKQRLENSDGWILGNNLRLNSLSKKDVFSSGNFTFLEKIIGIKPKDEIFYLLGCCLFFKNTFIKKLIDLDFFNKFIFFTNSFYDGEYPGYEAHDISEHLYPTLAYNLGGVIDEFANFEGVKPTGEFEKYYMRYRPDVGPADFDYCKNAYIIHPVKTPDNIVRIHHKQKRLIKI